MGFENSAQLPGRNPVIRQWESPFGASPVVTKPEPARQAGPTWIELTGTGGIGLPKQTPGFGIPGRLDLGNVPQLDIRRLTGTGGIGLDQRM